MSAPPLVWVVGAGGLLGRSVWRELGGDAWRCEHALSWGDTSRIPREFHDAVSTFGARVAAEPGRSWAIAWCAGAGIVATPASALEAETRAFREFLGFVAAEPTLRATRGQISLASSAGGVYGGCFQSPISESTRPAPISPYGHQKLEQEQILAEFAANHRNARVLVARFSNLYGPAQRLAKAQGLISHAARCLIHAAPIHIYVSLDTIRDYLFADDAGRRLVSGLRRLSSDSDEARVVTKLYASEREVSIAGLLGVFRQLARRRLRVIAGLHPVAALQPRRLQFRSRVWCTDGERQVELIEGVSRVYQHQLSLFRRGLLAHPSAPRV